MYIKIKSTGFIDVAIEVLPLFIVFRFLFVLTKITRCFLTPNSVVQMLIN